MSKHGAAGRCPALAGAGVLTILLNGGPAAAAGGRPLALPTQDADCLAEAVYYEAGGEGRAGREAVAEVVLNRLRDPAYPKTVCAVVFQGAARSTGCQFTFACDGSRLRRRPDAPTWREMQALAADALAGRLAPAVGGSTHYHALWAHPAWSYALAPTLRIGGHQFYAADGVRPAPPSALASAAAAAAPKASAFSVWGLQVAVVTPRPGGAASVSTP